MNPALAKLSQKLVAQRQAVSAAPGMGAVANARVSPETQEQQRNAQLQKKAERVWEYAAPQFGIAPGTPPPKIWQAPGLNGQEAETVQQGYDGANRSGVKFSPKLAAALLNPNSKLSNVAKETLIHEWVHAYQPNTPVTQGNEWRKEGGAEAFAREKAPGIYQQAGIAYNNPRFNGYPQDTREVRSKLGPRFVQKGQFKPVFGPNAEERGPAVYHAAYEHNKQWAKPSETNYQTQLNPKQEANFRAWVRNNKVPFNANAKIVDYDMRGYWLYLVKNGKLQQGITGEGGRHFPDAFKTPYDPTFSKWSKYAKPGTPFVWRPGNRLVNRNTGRVIFQS